MTFFINGIKLTTLDAGSSGFLLLCRDLFISFCFLFKFREQDKCARAFEDPHPSAASVWERQRGGGGEVTRAEASQRRPLTLSGSCYSIVLLVVISSL